MQKEWWTDFFDETHALTMLDRDAGAQTDETIDFLVSALGLEKGNRVFDQCCGTGALSHALTGREISCIGVDITPAYIDQAKSSAREKNVKGCIFVQADARDYAPEPGTCDAAFNWYTSFGYFESDADNIMFLYRMAEAVKRGGKIVLDITNPYYSLRHQLGSTTQSIHTRQGEIILTRYFDFDLEKGLRGSTWHYQYPDGRVVTKQGLSRLYFPVEIRALLEKSQFRLQHIYGDLQKNALRMDSPRVLYVAEKI